MDRVEPAAARIRGRDVRWQIAGAGPPLVLVHGLAGSRRWWDAVLPRLASQFTCHVLDLPRFGRALVPRDTTAWLADWFDEAGVRKASVVGHSLGGAAAARLAASRPDLVDRLVLVAAIGMPSKRRLVGYALPLLETLRAAAPSFLARVLVDAVNARPETLLRGAIYAACADVREDARRVGARTLLVWGERDVLVPRDVADEWLASMPAAELVVLPAAGHVPMIDRPRAFVDALLEFLDEQRDAVGGGPVSGVRSPGDDGEAPAR